MRFLKSLKNRFRLGQVKYKTIYAFWENNGSDIRSRQVPVWRGLISIVLSVINSGPNNRAVDLSLIRTWVRIGHGNVRQAKVYISIFVRIEFLGANINLLATLK